MRSKEVDDAIEDSKEILKELNSKEDKDFIGRLYYKNKPIEETLQIVLNYISELEEENKKQRGQLNSAFDNGFIHKDKIRDKIKHCENIKDVVDNGTYTFKEVEETIISILKELLGE